MSTSTVKLCGALIIVGGLAWSAAWLITGPPPEGVNRPLEIWGSGIFQIGLLAYTTLPGSSRRAATRGPRAE